MTQTQPTSTQPHPALLSHYWRLSVDMYHELILDSKLTTDDRVELLDGYLVHQMPQKDSHASTVEYLTVLLIRLISAGYRVRSQLPITLSESEPEPDVVVARGDRHSHPGRHPGPAETVVVIEVADGSLAMDREVKSQIYACDSLPVYWIVNLVEKQVEVLTDPDPAGRRYRSTQVFKPGDAVPLLLDGSIITSIVVNDLLP